LDAPWLPLFLRLIPKIGANNVHFGGGEKKNIFFRHFIPSTAELGLGMKKKADPSASLRFAPKDVT
jgi:hypothetical protein